MRSIFPGVRMVHSWNAEENGPMVAINDALGLSRRRARSRDAVEALTDVPDLPEAY